MKTQITHLDLHHQTNRNFLNQRCGDLFNSLTAVKEEGIIDMINNIIRLTEPNKDY